MLSALLLIGLLSPIAPEPIGDGGSVAISLQNATVHPQVADVLGVEFPIAPHAEGVAWVQCAGTPPEFSVQHHGREARFVPPAIAFEDGPPALWITSARSGRAGLEKRLTRIRGATHVKIVEPKAVPAWFGALRFAPLLMTSISTWSELSDGQRAALRQAAAAGSILIIGAGEGDAPVDALEGLTAARFLALERVGAAMLEALPRASTRRLLAADTPRIMADGAPLVVTQPYGLGEIRLVGARLTEIDPGPVGEATFGGGGDALGAILDWIGAQPGIADARRSPFAPWVWYALLGLLGLAVVARLTPRIAAIGGAVWVIGAALLPPVAAEHTTDSARIMAIPIDQTEHLLVGTVDVTLGRGGTHVLPAGVHSSLDEAQPGGACRLGDARQAAWVLAGEPNARRRLTVFAFGPASAAGAAVEEDPPAPGSLRAANASLLSALAPDAGMGERGRREIGRYFTPAKAAPAPPLILQAAPEE